jgi:hypothetical protein
MKARLHLYFRKTVAGAGHVLGYAAGEQLRLRKRFKIDGVVKSLKTLVVSFPWKRESSIIKYLCVTWIPAAVYPDLSGRV